MKIAVIGGGPGGLYFALLTGKRLPGCEIHVYEQNAADDTFGFGVVFSDDTLDEFLSADPESYDAIKASFAYWSDIRVERGAERTVIGGNGFAGCSRKTLLGLLQARCEALGVHLHFRETIDAARLAEIEAESDLVVVAQGINSPIRASHQAFDARIVETRNKFVWLGSTRPLDAFTFFFVETEHGPLCAHTYQYDASHSTWVVETTPECWAGHGFDAMSEAESAAVLEAIFAAELDGHGFITNRSLWRNFQTISTAHWRSGKLFLLGDAKATAHWSIGAGTKLAMECAAALSDAVVANGGDLDAVEKAYERVRRTPVEITQHNAAVSLRWFEDMAIHIAKSRYQFAFSLMSRAKALTWDNLAMRDPGFLRAVEDEYYARYEAETGRDCSARPTPMFTPFDLRGLTLSNRVVMAPMAQYCSEDGMPGDWHFAHYSARAVGGAGLVFTEMTCPTADARITTGCTGLWNDAQEAEWARLVDFIHATTPAKVAIQLGHAGRKGSTRVPEQGADLPMDADNWPLFSASSLPYLDVSAHPAELTRAKMDEIRDDFVASTERAARAGFDWLELHCAHGYLLASFLSPLTNHRTDEYGGSAEARARYPLEVFTAMRAVWPTDRPMSVRLSCSDWAEGGLCLDDLAVTARLFKQAGVDIIHASSGQTVPWQKPVYGRMWQTPFAEFIRQAADIPTIAVGDITLPEQINTIIASGRADLCAIGRPMLNDPFFARRAAGHYGVKRQGWPGQLHSGEYQLYREAEKANEKLAELNAKARPNRRHYQRAGDAA